MFSTTGLSRISGRYAEYRGDILSTVGNIMSTEGVFITVVDITSNVGMFSTPIFFMFSTIGRYHDTCVGDVQYRGG